MAVFRYILEIVIFTHLSSGIISLPLWIHRAVGTFVFGNLCLIWMLDCHPRIFIIALLSHLVAASAFIIGLLLPAREDMNAQVFSEVKAALEVVERLSQTRFGRPHAEGGAQQANDNQHFGADLGNLDVFGQTWGEQLRKLAKEKRMIRIRAVRRYRKQMSDEKEQPDSSDMQVALVADALVHHGNCLEDSQLFTTPSADPTWPCLGDQDLAAFRSIYDLSVPQVQEHANNSRLTDLINIWASLKMDSEVKPEHISDVRASMADVLTSWLRTGLAGNDDSALLALHNSLIRQLKQKIQHAKARYDARKPKSTPKWVSKLGFGSKKAYLEALARAFSLGMPKDGITQEPGGSGSVASTHNEEHGQD